MAYVFENKHTGSVASEFPDAVMGAVIPFDADKYKRGGELYNKSRPLTYRTTGGLLDGLRVDEIHVPKIQVLSKPRKTLPLCYSSGAGWVFDDSFKDFIEKLEPNVHQFFPITVVTKRGVEVGKRYLLNICNRLDAVAHDVIDLEKRAYPDGNFSGYSYDFKTREKVILRESAIQRHHLWCDNWMRGYFCSDAVGEFINQNTQKKLIQAYQVKTI